MGLCEWFGREGGVGEVEGEVGGWVFGGGHDGGVGGLDRLGWGYSGRVVVVVM